jgi:hypothetical protein
MGVSVGEKGEWREESDFIPKIRKRAHASRGIKFPLLPPTHTPAMAASSNGPMQRSSSVRYVLPFWEFGR